MTSIGQFPSLTWGHLRSRSCVGSCRSCCISADASWRNKLSGTNPVSVSLSNQKLFPKTTLVTSDDLSRGHIAPYFRLFVNNFWLNRDTDMGMAPKCLSRQGLSVDMQHDLSEPPRDFDLRWPQVKLRNWPIELIKYPMFRTGSTRESHWC